MDCAAVIDELKEEAAKRGEDDDGATVVDDGDKRKWMSTAQLWVDSDAKSDEVVEHGLLCLPPTNFKVLLCRGIKKNQSD